EPSASGIPTKSQIAPAYIGWRTYAYGPVSITSWFSSTRTLDAAKLLTRITQKMNRKDSRISTSPRIDTHGATGDHAFRESSADRTINAKNARRTNDTMIFWDRSRSYCGPAFNRRSRSGLS